jgi:uncharacterized protein (TIGR02246 family)
MTLRTALFTAFLSFCPACAVRTDAGAPAIPAARAQLEVEGLTRAHDAAWNAHDPDALASLFVDDAVLVTPVGRRVEGRAALRELFASPGPTKQTSSSSEVDSVRPIDDATVLFTATQTLSGPGVEQLGSSRAQLVALARRDGDEWKLVEAHVFATH